MRKKERKIIFKNENRDQNEWKEETKKKNSKQVNSINVCASVFY